jgi:hypothetical protein
MEKNKKANGALAGLTGIVLALVVAGVFLTVGIYVMDEFSDEFVAGTYAANASDDALGAMDDIGGWFPIIVTVAIAALILGLVLTFGFLGGATKDGR